MTLSPHILLDNDLDELSRTDCPAHYEVLVMRNIAALMQAEKITTDEFHHYCKRLNVAVANRPRSAA
jgi:hypothetical protein